MTYQLTAEDVELLRALDEQMQEDAPKVAFVVEGVPAWAASQFRGYMKKRGCIHRTCRS